MRAKFINERFVEDSDPIRDMGIGGVEINFAIKRKELRPQDDLDDWMNFLRSLMGKTIIGKFKDVGKKKFKIYDFESYAYGTRIQFESVKNNRFDIIMGETYFILH